MIDLDTGKELNDEEAKQYMKMLQQMAVEPFKHVFDAYFAAADEYTERTGKPAPEVLFVMNGGLFKATSDEQDGVNLEFVNKSFKNTM